MLRIIRIPAEAPPDPQAAILLESLRRRIQRIINNLQGNRALHIFPAGQRIDVESGILIEKIRQIRHQGNGRNRQQSLTDCHGGSLSDYLRIHPVVKTLTVNRAGWPSSRGAAVSRLRHHIFQEK